MQFFLGFSVDVASVLAVERAAELVEGLVVHVQHAMHLADDVEEVGVAALGEGELLQVGVFLQEVGLGDVLRDFEGVGLDVGRDETQLTDEAARRLVDVGGDKQPADFMHHIIKLVQIGIQSRPQQPFLFADHFLVFVHDELVAHFEKHGTEGCNAHTNCTDKFTADEWNAMNYQ